ncbi:MAG TPA: aldo/keto reductase [Acetobacteraceae bacterium]|nr:aldo/keto reductase [Acetobacteraceae bacterium]
MNPAETAPIGRTGLRVSRLGFGGTALAGMFRATDEADAHDAVDAAWEAGLRYFDTAPQYGGGTAERRLGAALRRRRRDAFVVSSKVGKLIRTLPSGGMPTMFADAPPHEIVYDYTHDGVLRSLEATLERTGLDRIDIVLIHDVNRKYHGDAVMERFAEALSGACVALARMREQGVIRAFGPALNELDVTLRFLREADIDCLMLPQRWTLLDRAAGEVVLPLCAERGVSVLAAAPFASGILATGAVPGAMHDYARAEPAVLDRVRALEARCDRFGIALASAALLFPLRHPAVASVVTGMRSRAEVERNVALFSAPVPEALWAALDE